MNRQLQPPGSNLAVTTLQVYAISNQERPGLKIQHLRKLLLITLSFISALATLTPKSFAQSNNPLLIAILDSPVDYLHPDLRNYIDMNLMETATLDPLFLSRNFGNNPTLLNISETARELFQKQVIVGVYKNAIDYIDAKSLRDAGDYSLRNRFRIALGNLRYQFSEKFRRHVDIASTYAHGTHVAGIMMEGLTDVKFIAFPILLPDTYEKNKKQGVSAQSAPLDSSTAPLQTPIKNERPSLSPLDRISKIISQNNIRIVNISLGLNYADMLMSTKFSMPPKQWKKYYGTPEQLESLKSSIRKSVQDSIASYQQMIDANPNTVFVLASGNSTRQVDIQYLDLAKMRAPNLLKVAALNPDGTFASLSNYSDIDVDLAARGVAVSAALSDGKNIHLTGTSMAAPNVANALAKILSKNPNFSSSEAIEKLFSTQTVQDPSLAELVVNGRRLIQIIGPEKDDTTKPSKSIEFKLRQNRLPPKGAAMDCRFVL